MLAVKLHRVPQPRLVEESCPVPIVDWKAGRLQIPTWRRWNKRDRHIALMRIPADHPVRPCVTIGNSNLIKQVVWPSVFRPLREWPTEYVRAIAAWWDTPCGCVTSLAD